MQGEHVTAFDTTPFKQCAKGWSGDALIMRQIKAVKDMPDSIVGSVYGKDKASAAAAATPEAAAS
jgi:hypothetical protein